MKEYATQVSIQNSYYFGKVHSQRQLTITMTKFIERPLWSTCNRMFFIKHSLLLTMVLQNFETFYWNQWSRKVNLLWTLQFAHHMLTLGQRTDCLMSETWSVLQRFFLHNKYMSVLKYMHFQMPDRAKFQSRSSSRP